MRYRVLISLVLVSVLILPVLRVNAGPEDNLLLDTVRLDASENLFVRYEKVMSGSAALVITGEDFRFPKSQDDALSQVDQRGPVLQAAGAAALVPYRSPTQKFSRNILLSRDMGPTPIQTEPALAVNPNDPEHLVVGVIDYNTIAMSTYVTIDGGKTWQGPFQSNYLGGDLGSAGDPIASFDREGNVYMGTISVGIEERQIAGLPLTQTVSSISVTKSSDGGFVWERPISSSRSKFDLEIFPEYQNDQEGQNRSFTRVHAGFLRLGFLDKPWLTVGQNPADPSKDIVYVAYTHFVTRLDVQFALGGALIFLANPVLETSIELVRSTDEGQTWSDPVTVSPVVESFPAAEIRGLSERVLQFPYPFTAKDGTVYVAWMDSTDDGPFEELAEVYVSRSADGGISFGKPNRVHVFQEPFYNARNAPFRSWSSAFPRGAVGPDGSLSLIFGFRPSADPTDDGDVYYFHSDDNGLTWTPPKKINDDRKNGYQFFPDLDVDPNGVIHAMWGDTRDDLSNLKYHIYYSRSEDGGQTWLENGRVTDFPSNPNRAFPGGVFIGDYYDLAATEDDVYMVWSDSRLGEFGAVNQKIAFARTSLMPTPSIFISPPSGPGGRDVLISGFNFQPDQEIFISVSGVIISTTRTDTEGRFSTQIFIPIAGEGAHTITAIEASGNVATASFFMEFGFDNLQDLQENLANTRLLLLDAVANVTSTLGVGQSSDLGGEGQISPNVSADIEHISNEIREMRQDIIDLNRNGGTDTQDQTILNTLLAVVLAVSVLSLVASLKKRSG